MTDPLAIETAARNLVADWLMVRLERLLLPWERSRRN